MKSFFKGVRKHIGGLDAAHLREQYSRVTDELAFSELIFNTTGEGYIVLDDVGVPVWSNPAAERLLGMKIDEIVDATGVSKSTVKRQLKSALDRLKYRLKD